MARNRQTLLEIVQNVLGSMNHDKVNSIGATVESRQIAAEAQNTYYDLMDRDDWPHLMTSVKLDAVSDPSRPTHLRIPDNIVRVDDIRYDHQDSTEDSDQYRTIQYCSPSQFLDLTLNRSGQDNLFKVDTDDLVLFVQTDQAPCYWTSFDDEFIIFDAYDSAVDTTIQNSKSLCMGKRIPNWEERDDFIPDMPDQMFSVFLAEVTAAAFTYWKQGASIKDEQRAARGISRLRKDARKIDEHETKARYGRRSSGARFGIRGSADGDEGSRYFTRRSW